ASRCIAAPTLSGVSPPASQSFLAGCNPPKRSARSQENGCPVPPRCRGSKVSSRMSPTEKSAMRASESSLCTAIALMILKSKSCSHGWALVLDSGICSDNHSSTIAQPSFDHRSAFLRRQQRAHGLDERIEIQRQGHGSADTGVALHLVKCGGFIVPHQVDDRG